MCDGVAATDTLGELLRLTGRLLSRLGSAPRNALRRDVFGLAAPRSEKLAPWIGDGTDGFGGGTPGGGGRPDMLGGGPAGGRGASGLYVGVGGRPPGLPAGGGGSGACLGGGGMLARLGGGGVAIASARLVLDGGWLGGVGATIGG